MDKYISHTLTMLHTDVYHFDINLDVVQYLEYLQL